MPQFVFTRRNAIFLGICLSGLAIFVLACMIPLYQEKKRIAQNIVDLNAKIAEQQQLEQVIMAIDQKLQELENQRTVPLVSRKPLLPGETARVVSDLRDIAGQHKVSILSIDPFINQISSDWHKLQIATEVGGSLNSLRAFLFTLLQQPYVEKIKALEFDSADRSLNLKILFSVDIS